MVLVSNKIQFRYFHIFETVKRYTLVPITNVSDVEGITAAAYILCDIITMRCRR